MIPGPVTLPLLSVYERDSTSAISSPPDFRPSAFSLLLGRVTRHCCRRRRRRRCRCRRRRLRLPVLVPLLLIEHPTSAPVEVTYKLCFRVNFAGTAEFRNFDIQ